MAPKEATGVRAGNAGQDEDLVRLYLDGVGKYPLLTREDEVRLSRLIQEGRLAKDQLARTASVVLASGNCCRRPGRAMPPRSSS